MNKTIIRSLAAAGSLYCTILAQAASTDPSLIKNVSFYVGDKLTYDDNLYRLPSGTHDLERLIGPGASRSDRLNSISLGGDGHWTFGRQLLALTLRVDDNRFAHNSALNNTSGEGKLAWNWQMGNEWSGDAGGDYNRSLVSFDNNRAFVRNLLSTSDFFADARYQLNSRWALKGGVRHSETSESASVGRINDSTSNSSLFAIEYQTPSGNILGLNYRYADASFPKGVFVNRVPFDRNYHDSTASVRLKYGLTDKTLLEANAGYLKRRYPNATIGNFSGDTWRMSLQWRPDVKTQLVIAGWRELTAYVDAESDYFVTTGGSITPSWAPTAKLNVSLGLSWEHQNYIGSNPNQIGAPLRRDTVKSEKAQIDYSPVQLLGFDLSYRREQRGSNQPFLAYDDNLASIDVHVKF